MLCISWRGKRQTRCIMGVNDVIKIQNAICGKFSFDLLEKLLKYKLYLSTL